MQEIGKMLKVLEYNKILKIVKKLDFWIPHKLKEIHLTKRINACDLHLKRNELHPFLDQIITGDEKWIVCNSGVRKRSWSKRNERPQTA